MAAVTEHVDTVLKAPETVKGAALSVVRRDPYRGDIAPDPRNPNSHGGGPHQNVPGSGLGP